MWETRVQSLGQEDPLEKERLLFEEAVTSPSLYGLASISKDIPLWLVMPEILALCALMLKKNMETEFWRKRNCGPKSSGLGHWMC